MGGTNSEGGMGALAFLGPVAALIGENLPLSAGLVVVFAVGLLLGCAGLNRRSWGLLLTGLMVAAFPMGFAAMVFAVDMHP